MKEYENITIKELIVALKTFPQDEKIGILSYDDGDIYGSNIISIHTWHSEIITADDDACKYYIY